MSLLAGGSNTTDGRNETEFSLCLQSVKRNSVEEDWKSRRENGKLSGWMISLKLRSMIVSAVNCYFDIVY